MIRKEHIIKKEELFSWLTRKDIIKVQIKTVEQRQLKNEKVCKIQAFYAIKNIYDLHNIMGLVKNCVESKIITNIEDQKKLVSILDYYKSVHTSFIKASQLRILYDFQTKYNIKFSIPKYFLTIINSL